MDIDGEDFEKVVDYAHSELLCNGAGSKPSQQRAPPCTAGTWASKSAEVSEEAVFCEEVSNLGLAKEAVEEVAGVCWLERCPFCPLDGLFGGVW